MADHSRQKTRSYGAIVAFATYLVPLAVLGCLLALNAGYAGSGFDFISRKWAGMFWLCASALVVYVGSVLVVARRSRDHRKDLWLPILSSLIVSALLFGVLEVAVRALSKEGALGLEFGGVPLKPYEWSIAQRHNEQLYRGSLADDSFYVGHPRLGWAAGPARESKDGLYQTSIEGIRSETVGENLLAADHVNRIALYGDSFVFSEEVGYDESLQFYLNQQIEPSTQVINFGMPGYGIGQAYLSFVDSVEEWQPQVAVLGFIQHDLIRALDVYTFLRPAWNIPFSKPRFEFVDGELKLNNVPNITPVEIFSAKDIAELPFLELDHNYFDLDWYQGWSHRSVLFRFLATFAPRYQPVDAGAVDVTSELGAQIASAFVAESRRRGVLPLVVYLPSRADFGGDTVLKDAMLVRAKALDVEVADLTSCLIEHVPQQALFLEHGVHYSDAGNQAFADCLLRQLPDNL